MVTYSNQGYKLAVLSTIFTISLICFYIFTQTVLSIHSFITLFFPFPKNITVAAKVTYMEK